jgi:hypothetical protein
MLQTHVVAVAINVAKLTQICSNQGANFAFTGSIARITLASLSAV